MPNTRAGTVSALMNATADLSEHFKMSAKLHIISSTAPLRCPGVGRDADNEQSLCFYFNRKPTDDEMRFLHEVMQRAAVCMRVTRAARIAKADFVKKVAPRFIAFDEQTC